MAKKFGNGKAKGNGGGGRFSDETRRKIADKARQREARKRALKAAEDLRPDGEDVTAVTFTAGGRSATLTATTGKAADLVDVVAKGIGRATPINRTRPADLSRQARAALGRIRREVVEVAAKILQVSEAIKSEREVIEAAIASRDAQIDLVTAGAEVPETVVGLRELTAKKGEAEKRLASLKESKKEHKAKLALLYAGVDRVISGEDPDGTLFAGGGE